MTSVSAPPTRPAPAAPQAVRPRRGAGTRKRHWSAFDGVSLALALAVILMTLVPLAFVVGRLFFTEDGPTLDPITRTLQYPELGRIVGSTLTIVIGSAVLAVIIGGTLAWLNERTDARMGLFSDLLPMVPFLVPPIAGSMGWVILFAPNSGYANGAWRGLLGALGIEATQPLLNIFTTHGMILVFAVYGVAFTYMMIAPALRMLDANLEEQSRVSGAGQFRTLRKVTLPAIMPSVLAGALLWIWVAMVTVDIPAMIGTTADIPMLSYEIVTKLRSWPSDRGMAVGLSLIISVTVLVVWLLQTRVLRNQRYATIGAKGTRTVPLKLGRWRTPARVLMVGYMVLTTVVPFAALLIVSITGTWLPEIQWSRASLDGYVELLVNPVLLASLRNSILMALAAATVVVLLSAVISLYVKRAGPVAGRLIDAGIKLPATLGTLLIVVGIVLTFTASPFWLGGTLAILFVGYILVCLPNASIASDAAVAGVGEELSEASTISGAGDRRTFLKVVLPLMIPGLVGSWAIVFVRVLSDLTVASMLSGINNPVIGQQILDAVQYGSYAKVSALATVLTLVSACTLFAAVWYGRRVSRWTASGAQR